MKAHCCEDMRQQVQAACDRHPDPHDCPDALVDYMPRFREYNLLVHDGGTSSVGIRFSPWCGVRLPESLRDQWLAESERRGIDPWAEQVPAEFQTSAWWAGPDAAPDTATR